MGLEQVPAQPGSCKRDQGCTDIEHQLAWQARAQDDRKLIGSVDLVTNHRADRQMKEVLTIFLSRFITAPAVRTALDKWHVPPPVVIQVDKCASQRELRVGGQRR